MRLVIDSLVAMMLAALIGGVLLYHRQSDQGEEQVDLLQQSLRRIEQQIAYHAAVADVSLTGRGFPTTIDPEWFSGQLPRNTLVSDQRPWLEIADAEQADFMHPPIKVLLDKSYASYWYNPYQGVVRARVPADVSDEKAITIYNTANHSSELALIDHAALRLLAGQDPLESASASDME